MFNRRWRRKSFLSRIYSFAVAWAVLSFIFPLYRLTGLLTVAGISLAVAFLMGKAVGRSEGSESNSASKSENIAGTKKASERVGVRTDAAAGDADAAKEQVYTVQKPKKKSYGPEIDPIIEESNKALSEMGRLYMSIRDDDVRAKINEIMRITDKIAQDAIEDPSDIPQIKKFFRYYLPTTIKLLNSYDRMSSQEIEGENIDKSMKSINEMLDVAIEAYKKRLDSLFENQALDIETDIDVMNQMLEREGLKYSTFGGAAQAAAAVEQQKG